jgi:hypothetical protein
MQNHTGCFCAGQARAVKSGVNQGLYLLLVLHCLDGACLFKMAKKALLRSKVAEINHLLLTDDIHVLTHNTFDDIEVAIQGYNIYRKYRNANGGGVPVYIQNHIPVKLIENLMLNTVEVIWLQVHLPHLKPILEGSCYRPPSAYSQYLDNVRNA